MVAEWLGAGRGRGEEAEAGWWALFGMTCPAGWRLVGREEGGRWGLRICGPALEGGAGLG